MCIVLCVKTKSLILLKKVNLRLAFYIYWSSFALTLKILGKNVSRWLFEIFSVVVFFRVGGGGGGGSPTLALTFHADCLLRKQFSGNSKAYFL